jgi:23S rRNA (guanosine2251-2'-O)-methyltransferase
MTAPRGRGATSFIIYGRRAVAEALASPGVTVERIWIGQRVPKEVRAELGAQSRTASVEIVTAPEAEVSRISGDPRHDQGVAAAIILTRIREVEAFCQERTGRAAAAPARLIALDGVTNPQNVGMIARSALAAGMTAMLWPTVGSPWISGLVIKASAGTLFRLPIVRCGRLAEGLWELKAAGFELVGLDAVAEAEPLTDHTPRHRAIYIVGSEAEGITPEVRDLIDRFVRIPMAPAVESLNAAVAASLVCFRVGDPSTAPGTVDA